MSTIYNILVKFLSVDSICLIMAKGIAKILENASRKGGNAWDNAKTTIKKIHLWCGLFLEVYNDDTMTAEEEQRVADAIKNQTNVGNIADILNK